MVRVYDQLLLLNLFGAGTGFVTTLVLGRLLGPDGYGAYVFALGWLNLALLVTTLGFHHFMVRALPPLRLEERHGEMRGLLLLAVVIASLFALALTWATPLLLDTFTVSDDPTLEQALGAATVLLLPMTLNQMRAGLLRGAGRPVAGQAPELALQPVLFLSALVAAWIFGRSLDAVAVLHLLAGAVGLALLAGAVPVIATLRALPAAPIAFRARHWLVEALTSSVVFSALVIMAATDVVVLGALSTAEETGLYGLAARFFTVMQIPVLAAAGVLSHEVARLRATGADVALAAMVRRTAGRTALAAIGLGLLCTPVALAPELLFGPGFAAASTPMLVLIWSRVGEAVFGNPGAVLGNGGHLRLMGVLVVVSAGLNLCLNVILVPEFGATGAAAATAVAHLLLTLALVFAVRRHFGLLSLPLLQRAGGPPS